MQVSTWQFQNMDSQALQFEVFDLQAMMQPIFSHVFRAGNESSKVTLSSSQGILNANCIHTPKFFRQLLCQNTAWKSQVQSPASSGSSSPGPITTMLDRKAIHQSTINIGTVCVDSATLGGCYPWLVPIADDSAACWHVDMLYTCCFLIKQSMGLFRTSEMEKRRHNAAAGAQPHVACNLCLTGFADSEVSTLEASDDLSMQCLESTSTHAFCFTKNLVSTSAHPCFF